MAILIFHTPACRVVMNELSLNSIYTLCVTLSLYILLYTTSVVALSITEHDLQLTDVVCLSLTQYTCISHA